GGLLAFLDRDTPVDAVLLWRVVAGGLVVRAAVVPDHDVALAPRVAILGVGLDHPARQLVYHRVALALGQALDPYDLAGIVVETLAAGLGMGADDRMEDRLPVTVFLVEQRGGLPPAAVGEGPLASVEELLQAPRQRLVRRVHTREERVAAGARHGQRIEL